MEIIVYTGNDHQAQERLLSKIKPVVPGLSLCIHPTLESLSNRLRQFNKDKILLILLTTDRNDLLNMLLLKDSLEDVPIVLILPDKKQETFTTGSRLHPRFVTYADSDFSDVSAVLQKMIERWHLSVRPGQHPET